MTTELAQLELLSNVDDLVARLSAWSAESSAWEPIQREKLLVRRTLERLEPMRARVEAPLVVATFGGTGVGKSSLVNALVGEEVTLAGRQRPTTTQPIVIAHPQTDLATFDLPLDELRVVRRDTPLLRDVVLIDCPDPDTSETETAESNLARLHRLLPFCDVLLYVSTQQKYRSARVSDELLQAASGCRLVFVQTHADLDEDIRDDWRRQLSPKFQVADLFFVDSKHALQEQQSGVRPTGEFGRLIDLLLRELSAAQRVRIRRANLLGLVHEVLGHAKEAISRHGPLVAKLEQALGEQRRHATERMSNKLRDELLVSRGLWEQRMLGQVTQLWGYSPFASVLRLWHSQSSLLTSFALTRARTTAQMALVGLVHGSRWLASTQQEHEADRRVEGLASLGLSDSELREAQIVITGYAHAARLDRPAASASSFESLRDAAASVQHEFLSDASRRIDDLILQSAKRNSHWLVRVTYEVMFAELPLFLLYRVGRNFFYDSFVLDRPLLDTNFYIPSALFLVLWAGLLVMSFTGRLRRGLTRHVHDLARELASLKVGDGLFPDLEQQVREFSRERDRVESFVQTVDSIRDRFADASNLGGLKSA
ncbi:MAG: GTPase domain-containing protein [Planctomycetota bacterium]